MTDEAPGTESVFGLDEYDTATRRFFSDAVNAVARADGVLSLVQVEQVESLPISQNTLPSGEIIEMAPMEASALITFSVSEGVQGIFDEIHLAVAEAAERYSSQVVPRMLEHISQLCDATGNTINAAGRPVAESLLEMLETIQISFDEDGAPTIPTIVMHPDMVGRLGKPTPNFQERFDAVIARRKDEWLAGRRHRRLPQDRH